MSKKYQFDREFYNKIIILEPEEPDSDYNFDFYTDTNKYISMNFGPSFSEAHEKAARFAKKYNFKKWNYVGAALGAG